MGKEHQILNKQNKKKYPIWITATFILLTLVISDCIWLNYKQLKAREIENHSKTVKIGVSKEPLASLVTIAYEKHLFSQEGIDVIIKEYPSGKLALKGMLEGEVEVATVAVTPIVFNSFNYQDFRIVATIGSSDNEPRIIARKDRGINKPGDLRGKRIATQRASAVHFFLHMFLINNWMSENNVDISFKKAIELPDAIASGEIDAFSMREPFISQAQALLGDNAVIFEEPGLYIKTSNLVALNGFVKDRSETLRKILEALLKAEKFIRNNPGQAVKIISRKLEVEEKKLAIIWKELELEVKLEQSLLISLEDEARWAIKSNLIEVTTIPNYLKFICLDSLKAVNPDIFTIIH